MRCLKESKVIFESVEWEEIIRERNENQAKRRKKIKFKTKERTGGRQSEVREGNSKIWDLKHKNSERLGIKL